MNALTKTLGTIILAALIVWVLIDTLGDARTATVDLATNAGQQYCS